MIIAATLAALAVLISGAKAAPRVKGPSLVLGVLIVGYVLGHSFWNTHAGPLPLTLDRFLLGGLAVRLGWLSLRGAGERTTPSAADWALALLLGWLTGSCLLNKPGLEVAQETSSVFRLLFSFWVPALLYLVMRLEARSAATTRLYMKGIALLGVYLGVTALCEAAGLWGLVFPRYIADPELGLHFGRARGPGLNSVSLGVYLGAGAVAAGLLARRAGGWSRLGWFLSAGLMAVAILFTYTRSTWLGLALATAVVGCLSLPRGVRLPAFAAAGLLGAALLGIGKDALVGLKREDSASVSAHSVQQRAAFAYVSMRMIEDHPLAGVGFGRFLDRKLPYLSDRRQPFELESLRPLHHHNTFLSLLTETGVIGLGSFLLLLACWWRAAVRLADDPGTPGDCRGMGLMAAGVLAVYLPSALFHDLTLIHGDQWLLFCTAGAATGLRMNLSNTATAARPAPQAAEPPGLPPFRGLLHD